MSEFKTTPFKHQLDDYMRTREKRAWAHFHEQGTGKSKIIVDTMAHMWREKEITGALIIAPGTVHQNWRTDEFPAHLPDDVAERSMCRSFLNQRKTTKWFKQAMEELLDHDGFSILTMPYSAFMTKEGKALVWALMKRDVLMVCDESGEIKNPKADRTKSFLKAGAFPKFKRILDGTPVAQSPFDVYSPIEFLDENYWKQYRMHSHHIFKNKFGQFRMIENTGGAGKRQQKFCVGYQKLEELGDMLRPISSRVLKKDVLDLPDRLYSKARFEMTRRQREVYDRLRDEYHVEVNGIEWDADLTIVRQLRLQQIACGYLPTPEEDGREAEPFQLIDPDRNPRLDLLMELIDRSPHQVIVWARFIIDIDLITERLGRKRSVRLDGTLGDDDRELSKRIFKAGDAQVLVANPAVGGTGLTLNMAKTMFFYSNSFMPRHRLQAEDRNHRIGQDTSVLVTDLLAKDSIDTHIVDSHRRKRMISSRVMGDEVPEWL